MRCPQDTQSVGSFSLFLRDSKDYSDSPQSLRKDSTQTSEQQLMSVFSAGQPSDLGALVFFTIILKCRFCQKIASHLRRMSRWWGCIGPRRHYLLMMEEPERWSQRHCCCVQSIFLCQLFRNSFVTMEFEIIFHVKHFKMSHYNCYSSREGCIFMEQKEQRGEGLLNVNAEKAETNPSSWSDSYFSSQRGIERSKLRHEITFKFLYPKRLEWP